MLEPLKRQASMRTTVECTLREIYVPEVKPVAKNCKLHKHVTYAFVLSNRYSLVQLKQNLCFELK